MRCYHPQVALGPVLLSGWRIKLLRILLRLLCAHFDADMAELDGLLDEAGTQDFSRIIALGWRSV